MLYNGNYEKPEPAMSPDPQITRDMAVQAAEATKEGSTP